MLDSYELGELGSTPSTPDITLELLTGLGGLVQAEFHLAQAKIADRIGLTVKSLLTGIAIFCIALLGAAALVESAIISLGSWMGGRYGLSSLAVGLSLLAIGVPMFMKNLKKGAAQ